MSRLQQGISKLNSLSNHGGSSISRLSSPSSIGSPGGGGKNFEDLKRQIHAKLVERLDFTRVRDLSLRLRPTMLDDLGLVPALVWLTDRFATVTGIRVALEHPGPDVPLPLR